MHELAFKRLLALFTALVNINKAWSLETLWRMIQAYSVK